MNVSTIKRYAAALTLSLLLFPAAAWAERHHHAHVHGLAQLDIALNGNLVDATLETPAANVIGFEHSPQNEEELHHAQQAMTRLKDGAALFLFSPAAECKLLDAELTTGMELSLHHDDEEGHHDAEKDHHDMNEHGHHHAEEGHHHQHGTHADIDAEYHFSCTKPEQLKELKLTFFEAFRGFEKIKLQLLSPGKQTGAELTPENNSISF